MSKINYVKLSTDNTIYPDNPKYKYPSGIKSVDDKTNYWFNNLKTEFNTFIHHKNSSIFTVYGHTNDNPTLNMPSGGIPNSERYNNMVEDVLLGCRYRIENYSNEQTGGWKVFEKIVGDYEIEIIDNEVIEERLIMLNKFTDAVNNDEYLTTIDPNTHESARTSIDPRTSKEKGIEYLFPYGIENTDELHYSVLELPKAEREVVNEKDIDRFIKKIIIEKIIETERESTPKILGFILGNYPELRPFGTKLKDKLVEYVNEINESQPLEDLDMPLSLILLQTSGGGTELQKAAVLASLTKQLKQYKDIGKMKQNKNTGTYEEVYKTISIKKIINRCEDEAVKNILMRYKPPAAGKGGGSSWPKGRGGKYILRFSQNPLDMLTKTTGRAWGSKDWSCENWDGQWLKGPQSDFHYGNCVVWVFNSGAVGHNEQIGRALIRWGDCYDELGNNLNKKDVGLEQQLYPKDAAWGLNMFKAIAQILSDNGYFKYNQLNTPYKYLGYSDYQGRGACSIQYNKPRFKGKNIELGENELMAMASNVKLAYATAGWLVSNGNEMVKRTLSQNPVIWLYETPVRRLINSSLDLEDGKGLIYDLITSDYADFNFMNVIIDTISLYDPDYDMWGNVNNFTSVILNHPNADTNTHNKLIDIHPGFKEFGSDTELGSVEELIYFDVMNRANRIDTHLNRNITLAPMEVLDTSIDKLFKGNLLNNPETIENRWKYSVAYNYLENDYSSNEDKKFYKAYRERLYAINNLILSPNLSNISFCKLLKLFQNIDDEKYILVSNNDLGSESLSCRLIEYIRVKIAMVTCFPFMTSDSWGWGWDDYIDNAGLDREYKLNIMPLKKKDRYFKESRQSPQSISLLVDICPEMFKIDGGKRLMVNFDSMGNLSLLSAKELIIFNHIQNLEVAEHIYKKHIRWGINPIHLLAKTVPAEIKLGDEDDMDRYLFGDIELECMLSEKNQSKLMKSYVDELDISKPFNNTNEFKLIVSEFLPDDDIFTKNMMLSTKSRTLAPIGFIKHLLNHNDASKLIIQFGVDLIARWLVDESDFNKFERVLYKSIFGKYYTYKNRAHTFTPLPVISDLSDDDWSAHMDLENMKSEIDITLLTTCANGLENKTSGLASNPYLPESMQLRLILPEFDRDSGKKITAFGNTKWSILSNTYGGDYDYYKSSIIEQITKNKGATGPTLRYIIKNYYDIMGKKILQNIAKNPNAWLVGDQDYKLLVNNYPTSLITNNTQDIVKLRALLWDNIMPIIKQSVKEDPQDLFNMEICDLGGNKERYGLGRVINNILAMANKNNPDGSALDYLESHISSKSNFGDYANYWRGGTWTKQLHSGQYSKNPTYPMQGIRNTPRNSMIRKAEKRLERNVKDYQRVDKADEGILFNTTRNVFNDYVTKWPYGKIKDYYQEGQNPQGYSKQMPQITKPQFIMTFEDGCFTYLPVTKYRLDISQKSIWSKTNISRPLPLINTKTNLGVEFDTPEEVMAILDDWANKYWVEEYTDQNIGFESIAAATTWIEAHYGNADMWDEYEHVMENLVYKVKDIERADFLRDRDKYPMSELVEEVQTNTGPIRDSIMMVYEVQEIIESKDKQPSDLALLLEKRFGIDPNDISLEKSSIPNYQYIGRKKKVGGKWVTFSLDSTNFYKEVGYDVDGWTKDLVIGFIPKQREVEIPEWRLEMSSAKLKTMFRNYLKNPLTTHEDYLKIDGWLNNQEGKALTSPLGSYQFRYNDLFKVIDRHKLWSRDIVNDSLKLLIRPGGNTFINNYINIKPTAKILELTMLDTTEKIQQAGYNITIRDVKQIQEWIVGNFSKDLPISYVYELITYPGASEQVKALVRNIRNNRLGEFIDYQRKLQDEMLEGGAEEYAAEDSQETFNSEDNYKITLNSSYDNLILNYCAMKHPEDLNKRRALMENIIYGKEHISIRELRGL